MFEPVKIAPSILSADFMDLGRDIALIEEAGAGYVHVDVMDGHFVPNLTMGVPVVRQLKKATSLPLDVHLMIDNPLEQVPWFLDAGADSVTVHVEALDEAGLFRAVSDIRGSGARAAVSVKPATPIEAVVPVIGEVDMVLVMSVEIGVATAPCVAAAGADVLVCGNAVFAAKDPGAALEAVRTAAEEARAAALGLSDILDEV